MRTANYQELDLEIIRKANQKLCRYGYQEIFYELDNRNTIVLLMNEKCWLNIKYNYPNEAIEISILLKFTDPVYTPLTISRLAYASGISLSTIMKFRDPKNHSNEKYWEFLPQKNGLEKSINLLVDFLIEFGGEYLLGQKIISKNEQYEIWRQ